jgi:atypical dual specificity phosphatase
MDVSQVLPNLLVGSYPGSPEDIDRLQKNFGVTAVLNVQTDDDVAYCGIEWDCLESHYRSTVIEVRRVPVRDFDPDDLRHQLPKCVEALDELLRQGHTVYVHCNMGINRSPTIVIAYLHWVEGWDLEKATDHVLKCRSCDPYVDVIRLEGEDRERGE